MPNSKNDFYRLIDSQVTLTKATIESLSKLKDSFTPEQMPIISTLISALSTQFDLLTQSISQLRTAAPTSCANLPISAEELERQRSVVVIGLPEQADNSPSKRAEMDRAAVNGIFDSLGVECGTICYRMGRPFHPAQKSPRPLKVLLPSRAFQKLALVAWQKKSAAVRSSNQSLQNVRVRESLTKTQLEERRRLHLQCVEKRQKDGKEWIVYAGAVILREEVNSFRQQLIDTDLRKEN
ncbi:hypothetical protein niasHT_012516 [Heterodera trifolii]